VVNQYQYDTYNYDYSSYDTTYDGAYVAPSLEPAADPSTASASATEGAESPVVVAPEGTIAHDPATEHVGLSSGPAAIAARRSFSNSGCDKRGTASVANGFVRRTNGGRQAPRAALCLPAKARSREPGGGWGAGRLRHRAAKKKKACCACPSSNTLRNCASASSRAGRRRRRILRELLVLRPIMEHHQQPAVTALKSLGYEPRLVQITPMENHQHHLVQAASGVRHFPCVAVGGLPGVGLHLSRAVPQGAPMGGAVHRVLRGAVHPGRPVRLFSSRFE